MLLYYFIRVFSNAFIKRMFHISAFNKVTFGKVERMIKKSTRIFGNDYQSRVVSYDFAQR